MYYIKYMPYKSIKNASRNKREIETASGFGFNVLIFSNDESKTDEIGSDYSIINDGTLSVSQIKNKAKKIMTIISNRLTVYKRTRRLPIGVWSCHDLHSLKIAFFATLFKGEKPILIYDSHEFELGRNAKRNALKRFIIRHEEHFLINQCAFSIMVNDSIADEVQRIHRLRKRPIVVRSTPNYWFIDESVCRQKREKLVKAFDELKNTK